MVSRLTRCVVPALSAAALLSIVIGPATAAARAECRARTARDQEAKRSTEAVAVDEHDASRSKPPPDKQDKPDSAASFSVPEVAKPTDGGGTHASLTSAQGDASGFDHFRLCGKTSNDQIICLQGLHHPVYLAHAPPADPSES